MRRQLLKRTMTVLAAVVTTAAALWIQPSAAQAAPSSWGNYGAFANEGSYPTVAGCTGTFFLPAGVPGGAVQTREWQGRQVKLEFYYSNRCGAYGRISNVPPECKVTVSRDSNGDRIADAGITETVDPGIDFAYTKIANNLNGRLASASLTCTAAGQTWSVLSTGWY